MLPRQNKILTDYHEVLPETPVPWYLGILVESFTYCCHSSRMLGCMNGNRMTDIIRAVTCVAIKVRIECLAGFSLCVSCRGSTEHGLWQQHARMSTYSSILYPGSAGKSGRVTCQVLDQALYLRADSSHTRYIMSCSSVLLMLLRLAMSPVWGTGDTCTAYGNLIMSTNHPPSQAL